MGVNGASWKSPYGIDRFNCDPDSDVLLLIQYYSNVITLLDLPAVHISFRDARNYCIWAGNSCLLSDGIFYLIISMKGGVFLLRRNGNTQREEAESMNLTLGVINH